MLYTSHFDNIDKLPKNMKKIIVARYLPKDFNISQYSNIKHKVELSPSDKILWQYKREHDWTEFILDFNSEIQSRPDMIDMLEKVLVLLKQGHDICFICHEVNYMKCHRYLLAKYYEEIHNIKWKEF